MSTATDSSPLTAQRATLFAALGDRTRLGIVDRLCDLGPTSIVALTEGSGVSRQAVTKHLRVLEGAGLVHTTRTGRSTRWRLVPDRLEQARSDLDQISAQWDAALDRLKSFVED